MVEIICRFFSFSIYALPGHKVKVTCVSNAGYNSDQEKAQKYLKVGEIYTVKQTNVHKSITYVSLEKFSHLDKEPELTRCFSKTLKNKVWKIAKSTPTISVTITFIQKVES